MKKILADIQSGDFAREWIAENRAGQENFQRLREEQKGHQIEREGRELRSMMDWILQTPVQPRSGAGSPVRARRARAAASACKAIPRCRRRRVGQERRMATA